jgi:hypothetical protein
VRNRFTEGIFVTRLPEAPDWSLPWVPPTGRIIQAALAALDRPILAWQQDFDFDAARYYADYPPEEMSPVEREVAELGERPTWRLERLWYPHTESSPEERDAYESACRDIDGVLLAPRCLDAFADHAQHIAGPDAFDEHDPAPIDPAAAQEALQWARAGICVLQASLPWPFLDFLLYSEIDNRPAHRILATYAQLLSHTNPREANRWWRAMVFLNPPDNMGARFLVDQDQVRQDQRRRR